MMRRPMRRPEIPPFTVMQITNDIAERRAAGQEVISLCAGEPSAMPKPGALQAAGYTGPLGRIALREAIAAHTERWYGCTIDPHRIAVTTGSSGAFQLVFLAAFHPGDRVALASPGYPAYRNMLRVLGIEVVELDTSLAEKYQPTVRSLEAAVREGGPLDGLMLASPANPTGAMLNRSEIEALVAWCENSGTQLISDEIYHGITYGNRADPDARGVSVASLSNSAIVVNSFSKYWGMTGWRLGWAVLPESLVARVESLASNFALAPPSPAQELAMQAFSPATYAERDRVVDGFKEARSHLLRAAPELGWGNAVPPDGAFYYYTELWALARAIWLGHCLLPNAP